MNTADIRKALSAHFPADEIEWRVGSTNKRKFDAKQADKRKGQPLAYITARHVMERLDAVMGFDWQCEYIPMPNGTCCCRIGLLIDGQWRWRSNGSDNIPDSDKADARELAAKASYSEAFKRSAVLWGIGQYLYNTKAGWIELDEHWGIPDAAMDRLRKLLTRNGAEPTASDNSNRQAPAAQIPALEANPPRPAPKAKAPEKQAPAPQKQAAAAKPGVYDMIQNDARSEAAYLKLIKGDKECRGIEQLCQAILDGESLKKLRDDLAKWVARASALRPSLSAEDVLAVEEGYRTFKGMLAAEQKAREDDAAKVAAA